MTSITIFGTGNMGQAIGSVLEAGQHTVQHIDTTTADPRVDGDIVVLAVPYPALAPIAGTFKEQLAGKVVVDITNPVDFQTFDRLTVAGDSSAAGELAAALPDSRVLKAFNTTFAATLASGRVGDARTTVLIAGDDAEAKQLLADAVTAGGTVDAVDAGSLKRARELEAVAFLQMALAAGDTIGWAGGFALAR